MAKTQTAGQAVGTVGRRHYTIGGTTDGRRSYADLGSRGKNMLRRKSMGGKGG
ncbi:hypothetical protein [uncultured Bilophila sp.]|uniref:hypothetical protein n=1 Tax=uncultured Bilophila sp. TaxID=529385 RepID=UPI0025E714A1|nr:hypothetical protein [uncultured Bilophila sp.]